MQEVADSLQPAGRQLPVFMGGISMGGCLTILTALRNQSAWQVHTATLDTNIDDRHMTSMLHVIAVQTDTYISYNCQSWVDLHGSLPYNPDCPEEPTCLAGACCYLANHMTSPK